MIQQINDHKQALIDFADFVQKYEKLENAIKKDVKRN